MLLLKIHCGKASKTLHQGREVTRSRQYSIIKKITVARQVGHCIRDERLQVQDSILLLKKSLWQDRQNDASGTRGNRFRRVICLLKTITMARQAAHCIRDEGLRFQGSILLLKTITVARQAETLHLGTRGYKFRTVFSFKKIHCGKAGRTLHQGREVIG